MKAIILAAGRGSRMGGLTDTQPKGLVSLRGKPLLEWRLASLRAAGIHEIALITGYRHLVPLRPAHVSQSRLAANQYGDVTGMRMAAGEAAS